MPGLLGGGRQAAGLLMDYASRMQRAREMGFDVDNVLYHGTMKDFPAFSKDADGLELNFGANQAEAGHFFTDNPRYASKYAVPAYNGQRGAPNVVPVLGRVSNPKVLDRDAIDDMEVNWTPEEVEAYVAQAKRDGHDAIQFDDIYGVFGKAKEVAIFDPANIRSINAAFDPAKRDSPDLLAGIGGAATVGLLGAGSGEAEAGPLAMVGRKATELQNRVELPTPGRLGRAESEQEIAELLNNVQLHEKQFTESQLESLAMAAQVRVDELRHVAQPSKDVGSVDPFVASQMEFISSAYPGANIGLIPTGSGYKVQVHDYPDDVLPRMQQEMMAHFPDQKARFLEETRKHLQHVVDDDYRHMQKKSPDLLAGIGGAAVLGGGLLGSGEAEASFFGPLAKTADKAALALAEKLKAEGADPKQILQNTGWFQGVDGKWRFEVDDRAMELGGGADRAMSGPLEGVVRHDELFRAYPDMRGIEASYRPAAGAADSDVLGSYTPFEDRGSDYFPIYEEIQMAGRNDDEVRRGLLHEMQHAVQQREGFAAGGSPRDELLRIKDERYSAEERLKEANAETSKISELLDNIRTLQNPEKREKLLADYGERYNAALARREKLAQLDGHLFDDRQVREIAFDRYRSGPGEVEARNVEARADLTPEQRAAKPPWETEDTTRTKQRAHMGSADVGLLGLLGSAAGTLLQAPETAMRGWRGLLTLPQGIDKAAQQARTDTDDLNYQLGGQVTDAMTPLFGTKAAPMMGYGAYLLPQFLSPF